MAFLLTDAYARNFQGATDASCVQSTMAALQTYMYSDATCYAGQIVAVTADTAADNNGIFLIEKNTKFNAAQAKSSTNSPFIATKYAASSSMAESLKNMTGLLQFKGVLPNGSSLSSTKVKKGYSWLVTADSGSAGASGAISYGVLDAMTLEAGDLVVCISGDSEISFSTITAQNVENYFAVINKNIKRSVSSEATSSTDGEIVAFSGTDGKSVKGTGMTLAQLKAECQNATTATSATKLATARSISFFHPVHGNVGEYKLNTFDGSKNMAAYEVDGIYVGSGTPSAVTTNFPGWVYPGTAVTLQSAGAAYCTVLDIETGSSIATLKKQLARFCAMHLNGGDRIHLTPRGDGSYHGFFTNAANTPMFVSLFQRTVSGAAVYSMVLMPLAFASIAESTFKAVIDDLEHELGNISGIMPLGTEFTDMGTGTAYVYAGEQNNQAQFICMQWQ
ncbi:MAG: hypothetical protein MJZ60_08835 [Bacteroidaceae bacterium]|nr:hypothetical protein [Bacteroidaceae bacterium]